MFRSETEFVGWLKRLTPRRPSGVRLGIGDDAAVVVLRPGNDLILKTDLSVEGVHFLRQLHPPRAVGHRALARSLSDIAAMGGTPRYALISLAVSRSTSRAWLNEFYAGILALARRHAVTIVGGDTDVIPDKTFVDVMIAGEIERGKMIRRSGAHPGDQVFVSGRLGLSALGLHRLKAKGSARGPRRGLDSAVRSHLYPEPRLRLGRYLSENHLASALIDVSDGLSTDLAHLCDSSGVGATVWAERLPMPDDLTARERRTLSPLKLALHGGEDYELLFTVPKRNISWLRNTVYGVPVHRIGEIRGAKGVSLVTADGHEVSLEPRGYDHFRKYKYSG